ncbi:MAG TPA: radical SAM protein [Armatimonadota bacterium]|nr:radical SAM protein [Armatimonadota bacterium]
MGTLASLRYLAGFIHDQPALVQWWFRNRIRAVSLRYERRQPDGISRFPRGITIKPTLACNLRCKMCGFVSGGQVFDDPKDSLPLEVWESFIGEIAPHKPYISLTGGEPLLYPQISELIGLIKRRGMILTVTTNGSLLAKRAPEFIENPPDALIVSIDGPSRVHNEVRGASRSFEMAAEGIQTVRALRKQRRQKNPLLVINCSVTAYNYRHIEEMVDIAHELRVDALNYQHQWALTDKMAAAHNNRYGDVHPVAIEEIGDIDLPPVDPAEVTQVLRRIRRRSSVSNGHTYVTFHPDIKGEDIHRWYEDPHMWVWRRPAACAWLNTDILPNGDVEPCPGMVCGNITQEKFTSIWNNAAFRRHRRRLAEAKDYPICVRCCAFFRRD